MRRMLYASLSLCAAIVLALGQQPSTAPVALAQGDDALPKGFKTTPVLKSGTTAGKQPIEYPKAGKAEIVSVVGELEPGGRTPLHQHPVPVYVYVLDGTLTVQTQGGEAREYKTGQAFLEDVNVLHQAFNKGATPAKILVVFLGEEGKPTTITAK
jgi:quercetin dioxygenase-like cupin family protein